MTLNPFVFTVPTRVVFGRGQVTELPKYLPHSPGENNPILLVTDKNVAQKSGGLEKILSLFNRRNLHIFDTVRENPTLEQVECAARMAREKNVSAVIGLGGGSCMDAAKGCAVLARNHGDMGGYIKGNPLENTPLPLVCIPTSSGSGSEVTPYAVFTNTMAHTKDCLSHPAIYPRVSIIDPALTDSIPAPVVINTGLDALCHAMEAYLCTLSHPINDLLALHAVETILNHLPAATQKNPDAMDHMAYAAMLAGIAIANAGTILLHIMAYPLTTFHHIPHGKANAILLPAFIDFMTEKSTAREKISRLHQLFKPRGGIDRFVNDLGISTRLGDHGVGPDEFDHFAQMTIVKDDVAITPAPVTPEDIVAIYQSALHG